MTSAETISAAPSAARPASWLRLPRCALKISPVAWQAMILISSFPASYPSAFSLERLDLNRVRNVARLLLRL